MIYTHCQTVLKPDSTACPKFESILKASQVIQSQFVRALLNVIKMDFLTKRSDWSLFKRKLQNVLNLSHMNTFMLSS